MVEATASLPRLDAMLAAPEHHEVLAENSQVRVLDTKLAPGERTPVHEHKWPAALYVLGWSEFVRYSPEGEVLVDSRTFSEQPVAGQALWSGPLPPHYVHNVGNSVLHIIAVEVKSCCTGPTIRSSRTCFAGRLDSGVRPLMEDARHIELRKLRGSLAKAYVLHVAWFALMCAFVGWRWSDEGLKASVFLTLVTVPPVLYYTVKMHTLCRSIDPAARTVGLVPVIVTTFVLSPFESGLILPLKNLLAANKLLKKHTLATESVKSQTTDLTIHSSRIRFPARLDSIARPQPKAFEGER